MVILLGRRALDSSISPTHIDMSLGPHLAFDGWDYECQLCSRSFPSESALFDHCRYTSRHEWCETCTRVFVSPAAKQKHLYFSPVHSHICIRCHHRPRFETAWELTDHRVDCHFLCIHCDRYLDNENNLRMVCGSSSCALAMLYR